MHSNTHIIVGYYTGPAAPSAKDTLSIMRTLVLPRNRSMFSLGKSPLHIFFLFTANGILVIVVDVLFDLRIAAGIFVGWSAYLITAEEIHWRIHLGGWLPRGLRFARAYHMSHHGLPNANYNVFLPIFDLLCGSNARCDPCSKNLRNA
jgi:hypothetical protein